MKTKQDFREYIQKKYSITIEEATLDALRDIYKQESEFAGQSNLEPQFDSDINIADLEIEFLTSEKIRVHVLVTVHYACYEVSLDRDGDASWDIYAADQYRQFLVMMDGDIQDEFQTLTVVNSVPLFEKIYLVRELLKDAQLLYDEKLLPEVRPNNLETVAQRMLDEYYYSNPICERGGRFEPILLANNMGLGVERLITNRDHGIDGAIFFNDGVFDYPKSYFGVPARKEVKSGTVIVFSSLNNKRYNNTLIHECVHWYLHRAAFYLQKLLGKTIPNITCRTNSMKGNLKGDYFAIREWQANKLSPKILCPSDGLIEKVEETYRDRRMKYPEECVLDSADKAIRECADEYPGSLQLFAIRLKELGAKKLGGFFNNPDEALGGHSNYIRPYLVHEGELANNETYDVPTFFYETMLLEDPMMKEADELGVIASVENHICIVKPNLYDSLFTTSLSDYARMHMSEFCLSFKKPRRRKVSAKSTLDTPNRKYEAEEEQRIEAQFAVTPSNIEKIKYIREKSADLRDIVSKLVGRAKEDINALLGWSDRTIEEVALDSHLSVTAFKNILSGKTKRPSLSTALRLCFGMKLPYQLSQKLLTACGHNLTTSDEDFAYSTILQNYTYDSLDAANEYLIEQGIDPLKS